MANKNEKIYTSIFPPPTTPRNLSVSQFLARYNPDDVPASKTIVCDFDNPQHSLTYGELRTRAAQGAASLRSLAGMQEGDVVCLFGQNSVNWMLLCHSILWGGGCFWCVSAPSPVCHSPSLTLDSAQRHQCLGDVVRARPLL